jgi:Tfp pilus assembly protein PilF
MSLDINPNQPDLYLTRATVRYDLGDQDGACHDWQKALEMGNPRAADLLYKFCKLP